MSPQEEIIALTAELNQHTYKYYMLDAPVISDYEFDQLLKKLQALSDYGMKNVGKENIFGNFPISICCFNNFRIFALQTLGVQA